MPADHEARSQVKVKEKSNVARKKALRGGFTRCVLRIQKRGGRPRATQERSVRIRRAIAADRNGDDTAKQTTMTKRTAEQSEDAPQSPEETVEAMW